MVMEKGEQENKFHIHLAIEFSDMPNSQVIT